MTTIKVTMIGGPLHGEVMELPSPEGPDGLEVLNYEWEEEPPGKGHLLAQYRWEGWTTMRLSYLWVTAEKRVH